jgi:hypothetical protein
MLRTSKKSQLFIKFPFALFNNLKYFERKNFFHVKYSFCGPFDSAPRSTPAMGQYSLSNATGATNGRDEKCTQIFSREA